MSTTFQRGTLLAVTTALIFATFAVCASTSPFVASEKTQHATLYLNVDEHARQIWPVQIRAVDGVLTNRSNQGVLWVRPGVYTFTLRVSQAVNLADVPGLVHSAGHKHAAHELKLHVRAGKAYYIGAKFKASGVWKPVVWKVQDVSFW